MPHLGSSLLPSRKPGSKNLLVVFRSVSDTAMLVTAFVAAFFICANASLANAFLFKMGGEAANLLAKGNMAVVIAAVLLVWKLLRWSRERNELLRQQNRMISQLNHTIRNSCQAIMLFAEGSDVGASERASVINSVIRIQHALDEYIPNRVMVANGSRRVQ